MSKAPFRKRILLSNPIRKPLKIPMESHNLEAAVFSYIDFLNKSRGMAPILEALIANAKAPSVEAPPVIEAPIVDPAVVEEPAPTAETITIFVSSETPLQFEKPLKTGGGMGTLYLEEQISVEIPIGLRIESNGCIFVLVNEYTEPENLPKQPSNAVIKFDIPSDTMITTSEGLPMKIASCMSLTLTLGCKVLLPAGTKLQLEKLKLNLWDTTEVTLCSPIPEKHSCTCKICGVKKTACANIYLDK